MATTQKTAAAPAKTAPPDNDIVFIRERLQSSSRGTDGLGLSELLRQARNLFRPALEGGMDRDERVPAIAPPPADPSAVPLVVPMSLSGGREHCRPLRRERAARPLARSLRTRRSGTPLSDL